MKCIYFFKIFLKKWEIEMENKIIMKKWMKEIDY